MKTTTIIIVIAIIIAVASVIFLKKQENLKTTEITKPPIVEHFACSDYCPGNQAQYMVKIYQGVEDPAECRRLGGRPSQYTGWTTVNICLAE